MTTQEIPREYLFSVEMLKEYLGKILPEPPTLATMRAFKSSFGLELWNGLLKGGTDFMLRALEMAGAGDESIKRLEEEIKAEARIRCRSRDPKMIDIFGDRYTPDYIQDYLNGNVCAVRSRNPVRLIVADLYTRQVDAATIGKKEYRDKSGEVTDIEIKLTTGETMIDGIFEDIKKIRDPLLQQTRWRLSIVRANGKAAMPRIEEPATFDQLCDMLVEWNLLRKHSTPGKEIVSTVLNAYEDYGLVQYRTEIEPEGFFMVDGKLVASKVQVRHDVTREEAEAAAQTIEEMQARFYPRLEELRRLAHLLKFAVQAPFDYARRQLNLENVFLPRIDLAGRTDTGKTFGLARLALQIHGRPVAEPYLVAAGSVETPARFISKTGRTTYPVILDEVDFLVNAGRDDRLSYILSVVKNQCTMTHPRETLTREGEENSKPSFSPPILTHNSDAMQEEGAMKRFTPFVMTEKDVKTPEQQAAYELFVTGKNKKGEQVAEGHLKQLKTIGDFAVAHIMENPGVLRRQWTETGGEILRALYAAAGREYPQWLDLVVQNDSITDVEQHRRELIKSTLLDEINHAWARHRYGILNNAGDLAQVGTPDFNLKDRIKVLLQNRQLSTMAVYQVGNVALLSSTADLLKRKGLDRVSMPQLAALTGFDYKPVKLNGRPTKVVLATIDALTAFLQ